MSQLLRVVVGLGILCLVAMTGTSTSAVESPSTPSTAGDRPYVKAPIRVVRGLSKRRAIMKVGFTFRGFCKRKAIKRHFKRRSRGLRYCYEKVLPVKPFLKGSLHARFTIGLSGRISGLVSMSGSLRHGGVKRCVARNIQRIRFNPPNGGVCLVTAKMAFSSR